MRPIWSVILTAGALALYGCGPKTDAEITAEKKANYVRPAAKPDIVECLNPGAETPAWISNGLFGNRVARDGSGTGPNGSAYSEVEIWNYDKGGEEKIRTRPCPLPLNVLLDDKPILGPNATDYRQWMKLDGLNDEVQTHWKSNGVEFLISVRRLEGACIYKVSIRNATNRKFQFEIDSSNIDLDQRVGLLTEPGDGIRRLVSFEGPKNLVKFKANGRTAISWQVDSNDFELEWMNFFWKKGVFRDFRRINAITADIEIDGPIEDQQAVRSLLTYLAGSVPEADESAVSPFNTSSTTYNGHVFWDADVWVFPALALLDPDRAKTIPNYRIAKANAAEKNFKERRSWVRNPPSAESVAKVDALQYPWESSVSGLEVSPTETKQEHHITGDVVWGLDLAASLGLADPKKVQEIGKKAATFYKFRSTAIERGDEEASHYQIHNYRTILETVSPDELYFGDHDLYTNALAEWVIHRFAPEDKGYRFFLPKDGASHLNYAGDRLKGYKQAAGALAIYPLQNPFVEREAKTFMDRFADKVSKNGPAMTDSLHALIWARLGEKERAYETWRKSWMDFTNHPLMLFSEKRNKDATYFSTGAAGCLQTVLYGFLGIRIDSKPQPSAKWSTPLLNGKVLSIKPNLPAEWKSIKFKGLAILGKRYDVTATNESVTVVPQAK